MNRILLAQALSKSPNSSDFRDLVTASGRYGFTKGNYNSENLELTALGEQLTELRNESERLDALRKGFRTVPLFERILTHYNNNKLPPAEFLKNALEKDPFGVSPEWSEEAADVFVANGKAVGFIRDISGAPYVILEAGPPTAPVGYPEELPTAEPKDALISAEAQPALVPESERARAPQQITRTDTEQPRSALQFFVAHGTDKDALRQLQTILNELSIPYVVAEDEANVGRPISQKVKDLMRSCSGGIFLFTADEEFRDARGDTLFRPRENVIYELGAASLLYDRRIVVFKERGVTFPTDFHDLGYIEFEKGQLAGKTMELLKELIALKAIKLSPGG